ncbi:transposase domain-containing protein [Oceanisphaera sp. DM8]|uniref:Transposase domain-containing protein n=1 Tax=Oceanisphaera pacifica TaxID=2818389 RepID=A0ABS3NJM6_9GAMM|nr:transposase domain-containing protein [Oceanisphaera pacifica]MBO1520720.1 transposase domain-containing protein [Oceanisphaera pacifica]
MKITTIQQNLKSLFEPQYLLGLARKTGFIKRLRQLSPLHLIGAIVQTLSSQSNANLADIHRAARYSLIETAKANNLDPQAYIKHILDRIAVADTLEKLEALLPWNVELD